MSTHGISTCFGAIYLHLMAWKIGNFSLADEFWVAALFLAVLLVKWISRLVREERIAKSKGCQLPCRVLPVADPFIGLDFIYQRLVRRMPSQGLESTYNNFIQLGPTFVVNRWTSRVVHTCEAENVKHMTACSFRDYKLPEVRIAVMSGLIGSGIFALDGRSWSHARGMLRHALSTKKMATLPEILERHTQSLLRMISQNEANVNLQPLFFEFSMDVATEFLMGHSTGVLERKEWTGREQQFVDDYMLCSEEATFRMRLGPLSHIRFNLAAKRAKNRVFRFVEDYIEESLRRLSKNANGERNFIQELSAIIEDRKVLRDQVLHMLLASRDTMACLLSNLFFMLAKQPVTYAKLREEITAKLESGPPTFDQLRNMKYLKYCVNESLRLHPVIPANAREAKRDTSLPLGGGQDGKSPLFVRKGTVILYNIYSMHRDRTVFGDDVQAFRPERWEGLRPGWNYLPFNGGPRVCLGQQFALIEVKYVVARLVQAFEAMKSLDDRDWVERSALATTCENGVHVSLRRA